MKTLCQTLLCGVAFCNVLASSAQVPLFSSYPSSDKVVFLDFDGHNVAGTAWNYSGSFTCNGANLTATQVTEVYNRVAEDYRPFTVNVTTDSTQYWSASPTARTRVVLTTSSSWYGSAGGVAYVNSFTWGDNTPCFVFTALLNYNTKNIAEAASHEIGHTLGLRHQSAYDANCNKLSEYNAGTGSGEIGWAPIMGVGYYRNFTLWHYGANPYGCTYYQDDLAFITNPATGITFRPDDHGATVPSATAVTFVAGEFSVAGLIERPLDADALTFIMPASGKFRLEAVPYGIAAGNTGANVDLEVELLDTTETVLGTYNAAATLHTTADTLLPAGRYCLRVRGRGNAFAPGYASLGSYTLKGTFQPNAPLPLHKLQLKATTEANRHKLDWEIAADEAVISQTIESSADGRGFMPLLTPAADARTYHAVAPTATVRYYRLNVFFSNGRRHYSNVAAVRPSGSNANPWLVSNPAAGGMLLVNSPAPYAYAVYDLAGRRMQSGRLAPGLNRVAMNFINAGLYVIRYENAFDACAEKFLKR